MPKTIITNQNPDGFLKHIVIEKINEVKTVSFLTSSITSFMKLQQKLLEAEVKACELVKALPTYIQAQTEPDCCYNIKLSKSISIISALEVILKDDSFIFRLKDREEILKFSASIGSIQGKTCSSEEGIEMMSLKIR